MSIFSLSHSYQSINHRHSWGTGRVPRGTQRGRVFKGMVETLFVSTLKRRSEEGSWWQVVPPPRTNTDTFTTLNTRKQRCKKRGFCWNSFRVMFLYSVENEGAIMLNIMNLYHNSEIRCVLLCLYVLISKLQLNWPGQSFVRGNVRMLINTDTMEHYLSLLPTSVPKSLCCFIIHSSQPAHHMPKWGMTECPAFDCRYPDQTILHIVN